MASAWSQLDQLLTCAICLDRYRNPKLLPCQHTFCMDPCLEGLIDYARRQIKCPECRAEHRIPYQGVQAFPTNVTLIRFLELHRDITGEEPEPPPSMMERCTVCSEKNYLDRCAHCEKKICQDCKEAHADVLRREINRINTQVRRGLGKLSDALAQTQKNAEKLQQNCHQVKDEIEEIVRRYTKDLRDTEDRLKHDVDVYIQTELRNLTKLKDDLDIEVTNMNSNCELVDKYISDSVEWTDSELVEYKDIFLKTLEFIRNFDPDTSDYGRKIRFMPKADPDVLHRTLSEFGELKINAPFVATTLNLAPPPGNALMRSQSDHRLAAQFQRRQEGSRSYLDVGQRFGGHASDSERDSREQVPSSPLFGRSRRDLNEPGYRRYGDRGGRDEYMDQRDVGRSRFLRDDMSSRWRDGDTDHGSYRSRYGRDSEYGQEQDHHSSHSRTVRFEEPASSPPRERVLETDGASKGPLSGIAKLLDSPVVLERLRQSELRQKQQEKEKDKAPVEPTPAPTPVPVPQPPPRRTVRQLSEDEIEKQKRQNQLQASTAPATPTQTQPTVTTPTPAPVTPARSTPTPPQSPITERERPVLRRVATLQKEEEKRSDISGRVQRQGSMSPDSERLSGSRRGSQQDDVEAARSRRKATESEPAPPTSPQSTPESPKSSRSVKPTLGKALSLESRDDVTRPTISRVQEQREEERKLSESPRPIQSSFYGRIAASRRPEPKEEVKQESEEEDSDDESEESESESESESEESSSESSENAEEENKNKATAAAEEEEESSSTSSESEEDKEDSPPPSPPASRSTPLPRKDSTDYTTNRSTPRTNYTNSYNNWDNDDTNRSSSYRSKWWETNRQKDEYVPKYSSILSSRRRSTYEDDDDDNKPYSRFLARSRSSALIGNSTSRDESPPEDAGKYRRFSTAAANLRRSRIARSKSSHDIGFGEESAEDESPSTPTYRSGRSWKSPENSIVRTRSSFREASPEEEERPTWSKYLRNKYGTGNYSNNTRSVLRSRSSHAICSRSASENSSDEEYVPASIKRRGSVGKFNDTFILSNPRSTYVQKKRMLMKIGMRGTEPGRFTWPRGVCVGPDNSIVVADSSNHRVQVFDMNGKFQHEFGTYGSSEGEFDCLAGVVVNRIGQYIVSDRYNHRIQVFDPNGRFLRAFGSEGRGEARFSYPWGITTDSLGFIYICDKENHRIQVFQSDGTFVGKFGNIGTRPGQLEHPHYIAVTNTNRVVVSDTNNHRIQTFDVNGRSLSTFGTEGSEEGQFKFPRGIAVDDQGYIIVGDSGNNRIQIFHPDGTFLKAFGTWGSADGEFKGLEGIAVASNGNILVCDRENHRIQVF